MNFRRAFDGGKPAAKNLSPPGALKAPGIKSPVPAARVKVPALLLVKEFKNMFPPDNEIIVLKFPKI